MKSGLLDCQLKQKTFTNEIAMSKYDYIDNMNPVDAVQCKACGMAFQVHELDIDSDGLVDWATLNEYVPRYCPNCGRELEWRHDE